jgi:membrane-bound lytic murein transglycosylase B
MNIPQRALLAYAKAELRVRETTPKCGISWTMLAGVGRKESMHGRFGGANIGDDGKLSQPIIGVPLDGLSGVRAIKDTDKGELDGDATWDHAVGPMQFLPVTWRKWAVRASGDGAPPDPQNMDDAALSAARYLCAVGGDLTKPGGWWSAVLTYNNSATYGQQVFDGQDAYARGV